MTADEGDEVVQLPFGLSAVLILRRYPASPPPPECRPGSPAPWDQHDIDEGRPW